MKPFKLGDVVRQIAPAIEGEVRDVRYNAQVEDFEVLVSWPGGERWFPQGDFAVVGGASAGESEAVK